MPATSIRHVVADSLGAYWLPGVDPREQPGMDDHVVHYAKLLANGRLEMGGPFLDNDTGGMMIATADVTTEELEVLAASDPAVQAGLLTYEIRTW